MKQAIKRDNETSESELTIDGLTGESDLEIPMPHMAIDTKELEKMGEFLRGSAELPEIAKATIDSITQKSSLLLCYILVQQLQRVTHLSSHAAAVEKVIFSQSQLEGMEQEQLMEANRQIHKQLMDTMEYCRKFVYQNKDILSQVNAEEDSLMAEIRKLSSDDRSRIRAQLIKFREAPKATSDSASS